MNDGICERPEIEHFLSNLRLVSGMPVIFVDPPTARVEIEDSSDCRMFGLCLRQRVMHDCASILELRGFPCFLDFSHGATHPYIPIHSE